LVDLLTDFKALLATPNLRAKVQALVPAFHLLRDLGCSLIPRNLAASARQRILYYFQKYPQTVIPGEELMVVAGIGEWARRVRELRTELGWPIATKSTGRPDLPVGAYVLEADRQTPAHDRQIPDPVRCAVLQRDNYECVHCHWRHEKWNRSDPRHLEL